MFLDLWWGPIPINPPWNENILPWKKIHLVCLAKCTSWLHLACLNTLRTLSLASSSAESWDTELVMKNGCVGMLLHHTRVKKSCVELLSHVRKRLYFMFHYQIGFLYWVAPIHLHQLWFLFSLKTLPLHGGYFLVYPFGLRYCCRLCGGEPQLISKL